MKLIGITRDDGTTWVARLDTGVYPFAMVEDFWRDPREWMTAARSATDRVDPVARDEVVEVPIVPPSARVFCVGLNYRAHAAEGSLQVPYHPTLFGRWTSSLSVGGVTAPVPTNEDGLDWEGEVAVYIGARLRNVDETEAAEGILGYSTFNDLTARIAQKLTSQWTLGKNGDRSGPTGPLVTKDETGDPSAGWSLVTRVNGVDVQRGNTADMIFSPPAVIALISKTLTLNPGDMIATGTPEGVGYVRTPPWLLHPGDTVEVQIDQLGTLTTPIDAPDTTPHRRSPTSM